MKKINCILLVDDNTADNAFHEIIITKAEVCDHIQIAVNGQKALDYLIKSGESNQAGTFPKPCLIYLDINMPKMNGFEFMDRYNKLDKKLKSKVVIFMLTTSLNPDDRKKANTYKEINGFENKPLTVELVRETVEKYFGLENEIDTL